MKPIRPPVAKAALTAHGDPAEARFPVVAIGASAGGLDACRQLLGALPEHTGCAFIVVQHLDPQHDSALTEILKRSTTLTVLEVTDGLRVRPDHVYVLPPNGQLEIRGGVLQLQSREPGANAQGAIDRFFESLAGDRQELAMGVVLSGNASDGTLGLEAIRAEGGVTFAQDASAKYTSMPRSAVASGCVDFVLPPAEIATTLVRLAQHPSINANAARGRPGEVDAVSDADAAAATDTGAARGAGGVVLTPTEQEAFAEVLRLVRERCGVDFEHYKPSTIHRRITRRMVLCHQPTLKVYADFLRHQTAEVAQLFGDLLINVTGFFRNPGAFAALAEKVLPLLLEKPESEPVRVWVLGCSTGQEAYSIAMAFAEVAEKARSARRLQLFATDLAESALGKARDGFFSTGAVQNVSPERLERFFVPESGGYRIVKALREQVVFARQNFLSDPPFSHLDLICCRNLLIYLDAELQQRAIPTFHYALNPGGFLFLGVSESIGRFGDLFATVDGPNRIFAKQTAASAVPRPTGEGSYRRLMRPRSAAVLGVGNRKANSMQRDAQREAERVILNRFAPPSVLIGPERQVLHFRGDLDRFFRIQPGRVTFDLLKMAREGLQAPLRAALEESERQESPIRHRGVVLRLPGGTQTIELEVVPLTNLRECCRLILFHLDESDARRPVPAGPSPADSSERMALLEQELADARDYLQSIQEQQDAAHQELEASNEEGQSANEELQSLVEELETSKEELQATNEELTTVNEELGQRLKQVSDLHSDLNNLQSATDIAVVLIGRDLVVRRFTPAAKHLFGLQSADLGQPLNLRLSSVPQLRDFVTAVITGGGETLHEMTDIHGRWHALRVKAYVDSSGAIDGAVLMLTDIDDLKRTGLRIAAEREHAEAIVHAVPSPLVILSADLRLLSANDAFYRTFGLSPTDTTGQKFFAVDNGVWETPRVRQLLRELSSQDDFFGTLELAHHFPRLGTRTLLLNARMLSVRLDSSPEIVLSIQDVTDVLAFQVGLRRSELRYRRLFEAASDGVLLIDPATRKIIDANPSIAGLIGTPSENLRGRELHEIGLLPDRLEADNMFRRLREHGCVRYSSLPLGTAREVELVGTLYRELDESVVQFHLRDVTERKRTARELSERARLLDLSNDAIVVRSHDDRITFWNKGAEKMFGWTSGDAMGQPVDTLLHTVFTEPLPHIVEQLDRDGIFVGEVTQVDRQGREMTSLCRWVLDRETRSVLTSYTNLSEFRRLEAIVREGEQQYRSLFNAIDEGFAVIELRDGPARPTDDIVFLETNPSFAKQSGLGDVAGKHIREVAPALETYWFAAFAKVAETGVPVRLEAQAVGRWWDVLVFRLGEAGSRRVALLLTDTSARHAAEILLRAAQLQLADRAGELEKLVAERTTELTATNKQLEEFVYSIAHDLRAPLRSMQVFSGMLLDDTAKPPAEARRYAERINKSAEFMDALLRDLLAFSKVSQQRVELEPVPLAEVVAAAISTLSQDIQLTNAQVEAVGPWPTVQGHRPTLTQVLLNLIANALKFVEPGEHARVTVFAEERGETVRVCVQDAGIGIAPEHQEQVFRLFTRLHGAKFAGTGVGLSIVQKGIERLGGKVGVQSDAGRGSCFWFELPQPASK